MNKYSRINDEFLFLGYSDGSLRVHCLTPADANANDEGDVPDWTLDNHWTLPVHRDSGAAASNGGVRAIFPMEAVIGHLVASCSHRGGLVVHK